MPKHKQSNGGGFLIWVILIIFSLWLINNFVSFGLDSGEGKQVGYIGEVEESGILWRPPEVRLLNIITTMSRSDTSWHYGIEHNLKDEAIKYQNENTPVEVTYEVRRIAWRWEYANRIIITQIQPLNNTNQT